MVWSRELQRVTAEEVSAFYTRVHNEEGVGVLPETDLAAAAGLEINNGIAVDEYARTSDPDIVAAGDCSFHHNPIYDRHLRLESARPEQLGQTDVIFRQYLFCSVAGAHEYA